MKVRYIGETSPVSLTYGEIYDVLSVEKEWYRIIDNSEEDYLYPPDEFEIVEKYSTAPCERVFYARKQVK